MPHYRDGTPAQIGDLVRGTGYNVKHADGSRRVIVGHLMQLTQAESCNVQVAYTSVEWLPAEFRLPDFKSFVEAPGVLVRAFSTPEGTRFARVHVSIEYGQADEFELIERPAPPQATSESRSRPLAAAA